MEPDNRELLLSIEARLERIEARQKAQKRRFLLVLAAAALLVALAAAMLIPALREYRSALTQLESLSAALEQTDLSSLGDALENLGQLDVAMVEDAFARLGELDTETLQRSLESLQDVDVAKLNGALAQMETVLQDLEGLNADEINAAITNLNKALAPLMKLFD